MARVQDRHTHKTPSQPIRMAPDRNNSGVPGTTDNPVNHTPRPSRPELTGTPRNSPARSGAAITGRTASPSRTARPAHRDRHRFGTRIIAARRSAPAPSRTRRYASPCPLRERSASSRTSDMYSAHPAASERAEYRMSSRRAAATRAWPSLGAPGMVSFLVSFTSVHRGRSEATDGF